MWICTAIHGILYYIRRRTSSTVKEQFEGAQCGCATPPRLKLETLLIQLLFKHADKLLILGERLSNLLSYLSCLCNDKACTLRPSDRLALSLLLTSALCTPKTILSISYSSTPVFSPECVGRAQFSFSLLSGILLLSTTISALLCVFSRSVTCIMTMQSLWSRSLYRRQTSVTAAILLLNTGWLRDNMEKLESSSPHLSGKSEGPI